MRWLAVMACVLGFSVPLSAQIMPEPSPDNPRIQSARWQPGQEIFLTALPASGLTIVLEPGEQISRVELDDGNAMDATVSAENDSLLLVPKRTGELGKIRVQSDRRFYAFSLRTGTDLMGAYLVQMDFSPPPTPLDIVAPSEPVSNELWLYRLKGNREVRPAAISDDGQRTTIEFAPSQSLPAVFGIGPSGKEQVVNGHMRGDQFVIDRVWERLVFRIDKEKATARRNKTPETSDG
ncbi:TrbG/VirB9 family P-type conjugative transfer protein [Qipengyuania sp. DGS5-3]|uniref:TrbG/VirB9 family P-type conjugative transfer protein n=1 Tax=Qipengyuania sp. DGS5-3 TaxID=3349632 RepID=UPI0036D3DCB1